MNLVNDLYISSHIPLIVVIISLIVAIMTINTFRYGEILIPTIIFAILIYENKLYSVPKEVNKWN